MSAEPIVWAPEASPVSIEYPLELMAQIRNHVIVGFHRLAKRGIECGGILYGERKGRRVALSAIREIRCEYRSGPSFILSDADRESLRRQLANPEPELAGLVPVGFYVSHTKDDIIATERDQAIYNSFFGDPWQIMLILRPGRQGAVRAGFFVREALGGMQTEQCYEEFELDPPEDPAETAALIAVARMGPPSGDRAMVLAPRPRRSTSAPAAPPPTPASPPQPAETPPSTAAATQPVATQSLMPRPALPQLSLTVDPPRFTMLSTPPPPVVKRGWLWLSLWAVFVAFILGSLYYVISLRDPSPILLRVAVQNGDLRIEWDRGSSAVQHASSGTLEIRDGARTRTIKLSSEQLGLGFYLFPASASDVAIRLSVSGLLRPTVEESANFVGEALSGSGPRGAAEVREQRDRLLLENRRLKNDVRRLEDRVKALENNRGKGRRR